MHAARNPNRHGGMTLGRTAPAVHTPLNHGRKIAMGQPGGADAAAPASSVISPAPPSAPAASAERAGPGRAI
jgi:hypothetical protein